MTTGYHPQPAWQGEARTHRPSLAPWAPEPHALGAPTFLSAPEITRRSPDRCHLRRLAAILAVGVVLLCFNASATQRYVNLNNSSPMSPYTTWATAATNIQDAIDVAVAGDEIQVTNGVYQTGARAVYGMSNRVAVTKPMTVRSVNGPAVTSIVGCGPIGAAAVRCAYLTNGAVLTGFTLTNGSTSYYGDTYKSLSGGGAWSESSSAVLSNCLLMGNSARFYGGGAYSGTLMNCTLAGNSADTGGGADSATLNNCTLTGNSATGTEGYGGGGGAISSTLGNCTLSGNSAWAGGGADWSTLSNCVLTANSAYYTGGGAAASGLNNCVLTGNSAYDKGGGAYSGGLRNCTVTGNSANDGGGVHGVNLLNCILYYNSAPIGANYSYDESGYEFNVENSCTVPMPPNGTINGTVIRSIDNITDPPLFVDTNGWINLRLQAGSPCINAGFNAYAIGSTDLDGNPRIVDGDVDMGAYEHQTCAVTSQVYVDRLNVGGGANGSICAPFPTVTQGYQAAQNNNTICIFSGNYNEVITMNKVLTLVGTNGVVNIGKP
jgi:hypothetical protein